MNRFSVRAALILVVFNVEAGLARADSFNQGATEVRQDVNTPTTRMGWDIVRRSDAQWLAVLYRVDPLNPISEVRPVTATLGQACGGSLVSRNKVLTLCACVRSFYTIAADVSPPKELASMDIAAAEIYVAFWFEDTAKFLADRLHHLDTDPEQTLQSCYGFVQAVNDHSKESLQTAPAIMKFRPEISDLPVVSLLPVIPKMISGEFRLVAYAMSRKENSLEIYDDQGMIFDPEKNVETVLINPNIGPFDQCPSSDSCKNLSKPIMESPGGDPFHDRFRKQLRCVCPVDAGHQLCNSLPGFPVTFETKVVGITASPMDCQSGAQLVLFFNGNTVSDMNEFVYAEVPADHDTTTLEHGIRIFSLPEKLEFMTGPDEGIGNQGDDHVPSSHLRSTSHFTGLTPFLIAVLQMLA